MSGYVIPSPKFRAFDADGAPLAGGLLYSYAAGTTTPLATYTDSGMGTPNANPVVLSAAGEATIFVPATTLYKFVLKTSAGVTQYTVDNVSIPTPDSAAVAVPPVGAIVAYGGATQPAGTDWLLCQGVAVSRTTFAALFAVIGTAFGSGDGSTTFNLPDLQQRFPLGKAASGTGATLGGSGGTIDHTHSGGTLTTSGPTGSGLVGASPNDAPVPNVAHTHTIASGVTGTGNPPFLSVNYLIKS